MNWFILLVRGLNAYPYIPHKIAHIYHTKYHLTSSYKAISRPKWHNKVIKKHKMVSYLVPEGRYRLGNRY